MTSVGYVGPLPPIRSGIAHHGGRLLEALAGQGADVHAHSWASQYPRFLYPRAERDDYATAMPGVRWSMRWWDPSSWVRVGRSLRTMDRLLLPWTVPVHAPHLLTVMRSAGVPTTVLVHNCLPHEAIPGSAAAARLVLGRADKIVTHAASVAAECRELAPSVPVDVVDMPPLLHVPQRPMPPGPLKLLVLGHLRHYKGVDVAIDAVATLVDAGHDLTLTIAGEPWDGDPQPWIGMVSRAGLAGRVRLDLRFQSDAEVADLLAGHHLLVASYRSATQSGVVSLALAAGRGVVATTVGGLPDCVQDGVNGTLADPDDVVSLADAIVRAGERVADLGAEAGRRRARWDTVARAVLALPVGATVPA